MARAKAAPRPKASPCKAAAAVETGSRQCGRRDTEGKAMRALEARFKGATKAWLAEMRAPAGHTWRALAVEVFQVRTEGGNKRLQGLPVDNVCGECARVRRSRRRRARQRSRRCAAAPTRSANSAASDHRKEGKTESVSLTFFDRPSNEPQLSPWGNVTNGCDIARNHFAIEPICENFLTNSLAFLNKLGHPTLGCCILPSTFCWTRPARWIGGNR